MTRVLAAALISAMTIASIGLASAATAPAGGSTTDTAAATVSSSANHAKVADSTKPVTHKKKVAKPAGATAAHPATKTQEVGKMPAKPAS